MFPSLRRPVGRPLAPMLALSAALCAQAALAQGGTIKADAAWLRETATGQSAGGGFVTLVNRGKAEDRLIGGSTPMAAQVQIHNMSMEGGVMRMRPLKDGLALPAGQAVTLKPGGEHIMLMGLKRPLKRGETVPVTLHFAKAGKVTVRFVVQPVTYAATSNGGGHDRHH